MAVGQFRSYIWDPLLIISQIIAVQSIFYLCLGAWLFCIYSFAGQQVLVQHLFDPTIVSFSASGRIYLCIFILNSLSNSIALWFIVQRAKQCLDFTCTSHFLHLIVCWSVSSFPTVWTWWVMNFACIVLTSLLNVNKMMCITAWIFFVAIGFNDLGTSFSMDAVFSIDGLIAAYGDFNSDQALDMFVISSDWTQLKIYVWNVAKQTFFNLDSAEYKTNANEHEVIVSITTADFDGDGCLDVLICLSSPKNEKEGYIDVVIYYGDTITLSSGKWTVKMLDQPSVIDVNGDLLPDLFGTSSKGVRSYWISVPADVSSQAHFTEDAQFCTDIFTTLVIPQSNAFVDLTGDQHADLVVKSYSNETKSIMIEIWAQETGNKNLSLQDSFELGLINITYAGQMSFGDYDGDGVIDLMLPACLTDDCSHSVLYACTIKLAEGGAQNNSKWSVVIDNTFGDWQFPLHKMNGSDKIPLTLIIGDYLLDGMIDAVVILQNKENQKLFAANLINIPCSDSKKTGCEGKRTFSVQNAMSSVQDPVSVSLMDVYENGILDFLVTCQTGNSYETKILKNELIVDAAFLKVAVVGGICYTDCKCSKGLTRYGAHQAGAMIDIKTTNTDGHLMVINAVQLAQSAYFSLQLPYVIFGLGKSPNFVDEINIGIPKGDQSVNRVHEWVAIIPNAQVIVIPYPKDSPADWMTKLLVARSKMFLQTGGVLLGTCLLIAGIIIILHVKEKKEDEREKRKEAHKFHFDAL